MTEEEAGSEAESFAEDLYSTRKNHPLTTGIKKAHGRSAIPKKKKRETQGDLLFELEGPRPPQSSRKVLEGLI